MKAKSSSLTVLVTLLFFLISFLGCSKKDEQDDGSQAGNDTSEITQNQAVAESQAASSQPNQPTYLQPTPPDKLKEDLDFLFKTIEVVHPNMYTYISKGVFTGIREQLYQSINRPMNRLEFYKLVAPAVAAIKNSHTAVLPPHLQEFTRYYLGGGPVFPLEISWDEQNPVVCKNYSNDSLPPNCELLVINGRSVREMFADFSELFAAEGKHPYRCQLTNNPDSLRFLLFLEYGQIESWNLQIRSEDGEVNNHTIRSVPATEILHKKAKDNDVASKFRYQYFPDNNAVLLEIKSFGGKLDQPEVFRHAFKQFLNKSFRKIRKQKASNLIIDVRDNEGGGDNFVHLLLEYLTSKPYRLYEKTVIKISAQSHAAIEHIRRQVPDKFANKKEGHIVTIELPFKTFPAKALRFSGHVFVLIGSRSWSASTVFASAVKCFNVGTLVGEETPDPPTLYGSVVYSKLPHSELQFGVASKLMVAACGKPDGRGVLPDYEVKQKPQDTAKGVDTTLQYTLNLINKL